MTEQEPRHEPHAPVRRKRDTISKSFYFVSLAAVALIGFAVGTRHLELYAAVAPLFGAKVSSATLDDALLQRTYRELAANYDGKLDTSKLVDGAARGMVAAAGDRYTVFMDKDEASEFGKELSGEVTGIGCELSVRAGQPTIVRVLKDSPAERAGLLAGDVFVKVNEESVVGSDASQVASRIRGQEGTSVKVTVQRGGEEKLFTMTRAKLNDPSVRWAMQGTVGVLTISRFDNDTAKLARQAAESFKSQGATSVILDLRDDGGGYLDAAKDVASIWLKAGTAIVTEKTDGQVTDTINASGGALLEGMKTIVLVTGGSASASEIVAGALQDNKAATLLGEKTFGKGSVQKLIDLPDGRKLKVTIARWYTPAGKNITKEGIAPDTTVTLTSEDRNAGRDPQLEAAKKALSQ